MCQHFLGRLAVPGFAFWLFGDGGCRGHAVAPSIASPALGGGVLSSVVLSTRHIARAIISSSSVRMTRPVARLASIEITSHSPRF